MTIAAVSEREDPSDLLLICKNSVDESQKWGLKQGAVVGTSSARRKSQVMRYRPDVTIQDLRGNVPTRIQKLADGGYDAILLAKAGIDRLKIKLDDFHVVVLDPRAFVPAPAQGVLGLQIRENDTELAKLLSELNHTAVQQRIAVERKVLNLLQGGCQLPLGVYCPDEQNVYVSFGENWEDGAILAHYEVEDLENIAEIIVEDLHNPE